MPNEYYTRVNNGRRHHVKIGDSWYFHNYLGCVEYCPLDHSTMSLQACEQCWHLKKDKRKHTYINGNYGKKPKIMVIE